MKRDKLYTINKGNKPIFAQGVDRVNHNIFDGEFGSYMNNAYNPQIGSPLFRNNSTANPFGITLSAPTSSPNINWSSPSQVGNSESSAGSEINWGAVKQGAQIGAGAILSSDLGDRALDEFDPIWHLAGQNHSAVGDSLSSAGKGIFKAGVSSGNPALMLAGAGAKIVGGLANAAFGYGIQNEQAVKNNIGNLKNVRFNGDFDAIQNQAANTFLSRMGLGKVTNGWFNSKGTRKAKDLTAQQENALAFANNSLNNAIYNAQQNQTSGLLRKYSAFGGPLEAVGDMGMSAINYDLMTDLINNKKREVEQKNTVKGISPIPNNVFCRGGKFFHGGGCLPTIFSLGGDLQANGADWTTGMTHIDAGGSHEENPNEGVQMGVDREGTPNLVEEGETVFNDYVYSNRIELDDKAKEAFHVNKKHKIAYSDFSKKLEKESIERPNDPISQAGLKAQLEDLAEHQERQKQEMEEKRAQEAFDALTPEEQAGLMQYAQEEEQAEQEAAQEQAAQEQMMQQMSPEEQAMMQQQMVSGSTPNLGAEPQMSAYGGNLYAGGGILDLLNILGYKDISEAEKAGWKPSDFGDFNSWDAITKESKLSDGFTWSNDFASRVTNPTAKAALSLGWNPLAEALTSSWYEGSSGNELSWGPSARKKKFNKRELEEIASRYPYTIGKAIEQGYIKSPEGNNTISSKEIVEGARKTEDRKKTDEWLQDKANQIAYLGRVRKLAGDDPAFQKAWSPYGNFVQNGDSWAFNLVNENPVVNGKALPSFSDYFWTSRNDDAIGNMHDSMHAPGSAVKRYTLDESGNPVLLEDNDLSKYEQIGDYTWGDAAKDLNNQALFYKLKGNNPKTYHAVIGDDDWHLENELDWSKVGDEVRRETLPNNEGVVIYHAGKGPGADETVETAAGNNRKIVPVHRNENLRYAGLFGPAIGLGMQALGLGKPDTSRLDASLKMTNDLAFAKPYLIGDYMKYNPLDRLFYSNQLQANSRATDRGIMNTSGGNRGAAMAGLIANGYNTNNNLGNLYRQAEEYNRGQYERTKEFNRGTNQFNAQTLTHNSQFNADAYNRNRQFAAQMAANVANQKMDADAGWWNGIYGNIGGLFKGIGDLGRENYQHNRIADMAATGIFGTMKPETFVSNGYLRYEDEDPTWLKGRTRKVSKGGRINRKKGGK